MDLADRHVVVTGASRGLGAQFATEFASAGARVTVVARTLVDLEAVADAIGGRAYACDLTDPDHVADLVDRIEADNGPIDVLVNNAGVDATAYFPTQSLSDLEMVYRLNLLTPVQLCRQVLPGMLDRGRGHLVNVSSIAAGGAFPGLAAYGSSKAGLSQFTAGLRADLRGREVGTTLVEVGPIGTEMLETVKEWPPTRHSFDRFYRLRLLRDLSPQEVAGATVTAVTNGHRHVRLPRRAAAVPLLAEIPRRAVEWVLTGVSPESSR